MATTITGSQIRDETVTDADIGPNAVGSSEISSTAITGQPELNPAAGGDFVLVSDTDDSGNLKKVQVGNLGLGGGSSTSISDADSNTKIQVEESADENKIRFDTAGIERMQIDNNGKVGIGTTDPGYNLHIAGAAAAVVLIDGAAGADAFLRFGQAGTLKSYIKQGSGGNLVITNETADKDIIFNIKDNTTSREGLRLNGDVAEVVINFGSDSLVDFRVESNNNTHMLYVDGGNNTVGIGVAAPTSKFTVNGPISTAVTSTDGATYTITGDNSTILMDSASNSVTVTLPAISGIVGRIYTIKHVNMGIGNNASIATNASETIDGSTSARGVMDKETVVLQCASNGWVIIGGYIPPPPGP
jgi:hypothetical protein